jgi:DNA-binding LacI/PurR family transcriptional regulator
VQYLAALGHTRVAHVTGVGDFVHTTQRAEAFRRVAGELGLGADVVESDYSAESGARATRRLLSSPRRPSAILFDSDLLAVTGLGVAQRMGLVVPDDVSIIGWDDSLISQVVHPPLTAITRDIEAYGVAVARHLLGAIDGKPVGDLETEAGALTTRASTAPPRGRGLDVR